LGFVGFVGLSLGFNFFLVGVFGFGFWVFVGGFCGICWFEAWDSFAMEPADLLKPLLRGWSLPLLVFTVAYTLVYLPFVEKGVRIVLLLSLSPLSSLAPEPEPLVLFLGHHDEEEEEEEEEKELDLVQLFLNFFLLGCTLCSFFPGLLFFAVWLWELRLLMQ
jgi:hypothetical protein